MIFRIKYVPNASLFPHTFLNLFLFCSQENFKASNSFLFQLRALTVQVIQKPKRSFCLIFLCFFFSWIKKTLRSERLEVFWGHIWCMHETLVQFKNSLLDNMSSCWACRMAGRPRLMLFSCIQAAKMVKDKTSPNQMCIWSSYHSFSLSLSFKIYY